MFGMNQQQPQISTMNCFPMQGQQGYMQQQQPTVEQIRQMNQQKHLSNIQQVLKKVYEIQNQPQLSFLIQVLTKQQKQSVDMINKSIDQTDINKFSSQEAQRLCQRGIRIKQRNQRIVLKILQLKTRLERMMYQSMSQNPRNELQMNQTMDKIRYLKSEITQKCAYLKTLKVNRSNDQQQWQRQRNIVRKGLNNEGNFSTLGSSMNQLKNGIEVLQKDVMRKRLEMQEVKKFCEQRV